jgi:glycosyltransferase involved in cell wall biosynthesis
MRVMMFSWEYPPHLEGGMGQHVKALVPALLDAAPDLELHVVTPTFVGETSAQVGERLMVHRVRVDRPSSEHFYQDVQQSNHPIAERAMQLVRSHRPFDFLHVHDWLVGFAAMTLHEAVPMPILSTIHATERGRYRGALYSDLSRSINQAECRLAQSSQYVITCSRAMALEVRDYFHVSQGHTRVIPNGVDTSRFDLLREQDHTAFRAHYAPSDELVVFNVGRVVYEKGADLLVEAVPAILQQVPRAKFVIGGRGPLLASLEQRIREMHLSDRVMLTGYLSDIDRDRLYVIADCCVFPSRYEPFGIVALEAMAAGTPVVVSDVGGLGAVVKHGTTGLTVFPENVGSLAWGIIQTLIHPLAAQERATQAFREVHECLSWPIIAELTVEVYREIVAQGAYVTTTESSLP